MTERGWLVMACLALGGVVVLAAFPARSYIDQRHQQHAVEQRVRALSDDNHRLTERAAQLQTDAEIERLAREQYGLVRPGEEVYAVVGSAPAQPPPPAPPAPHVRAKHWWEKVLEVVTSLF